MTQNGSPNNGAVQAQSLQLTGGAAPATDARSAQGSADPAWSFRRA